MKIIPICTAPARELGLLFNLARKAYDDRIRLSVLRPSSAAASYQTSAGRTYLFKMIFAEEASFDQVRIIKVREEQTITPLIYQDWPGGSSIFCFYGPNGGTNWHTTSGLNANTQAIVYAVGGKSASPVVLSSTNPSVLSIASEKVAAEAFLALYNATPDWVNNSGPLEDLVPDFDDSNQIYKFTITYLAPGYVSLYLNQAASGIHPKAPMVFGGNFHFAPALVPGLILSSGGSVSGGQAAIETFHPDASTRYCSGGSVSTGKAVVVRELSKRSKGGSASSGRAIITSTALQPPTSVPSVTLRYGYTAAAGSIYLSLVAYCTRHRGGTLSFEYFDVDGSKCTVTPSIVGEGSFFRWIVPNAGGSTSFKFQVSEDAQGVKVKAATKTTINVYVDEPIISPIAHDSFEEFSYTEAHGSPQIVLQGEASRGGVLTYSLSYIGAHMTLTEVSPGNWSIVFEENWHGSTVLTYHVYEIFGGQRGDCAIDGTVDIVVDPPMVSEAAFAVSAPASEDGRFHLNDPITFYNRTKDMPDGSSLSFEWACSNSGDTFIPYDGQTARVIVKNEDDVTVTLTATDDYGQSSTASVTIKIYPILAKPIFNSYSANLSNVAAAQGAVLSFSGSPVRGGILSYHIVDYPAGSSATLVPPAKFLFKTTEPVYSAKSFLVHAYVTETTSDGLTRNSDTGYVQVNVAAVPDVVVTNIEYNTSTRTGTLYFTGGSGFYSAYMSTSNITGFGFVLDQNLKKVTYDWTALTENDNITVFCLKDEKTAKVVNVSLSSMGIPPKGTVNSLAWVYHFQNMHHASGFKAVNSNYSAKAEVFLCRNVPVSAYFSNGKYIVQIGPGGCFDPGAYLRVTDLYAGTYLDHYITEADVYPPACPVNTYGWVTVWSSHCEVSAADISHLFWTDVNDFSTVQEIEGWPTVPYRNGNDNIRITMGFNFDVNAHQGNHSFQDVYDTLLSLGIADPYAYWHMDLWEQWYTILESSDGTPFGAIHVTKIERYQLI